MLEPELRGKHDSSPRLSAVIGGSPLDPQR